jgi:sugar/nucleoside kinase (ribokinase family)
VSLLVVGTVGIDSIETPAGVARDVLGGSATYFAYAASFFTKVYLLSVVGEDFPPRYRELLARRGIDLSGLHVQPSGKTFRWHGIYSPDMNERQTMEVQLNVLKEFRPHVSPTGRGLPFAFLANASPQVQLATLEQLERPRLVVADTMDFWIQTEHEALAGLLRRITGLIVNDQEARLLSGESSVIRAAQQIHRMGPKFVVVKKSEHGALFFDGEATYVLPAFPTDRVVDPTGAGDSFAGGFMGWLASHGGDLSAWSLKQAMAYGIVTASFTVEGFSVSRLEEIDRTAIEERMAQFRQMVLLQGDRP